MLSNLVSAIDRFINRKKNIPRELYAEGLRNENSGDFKAALQNYERALSEAGKMGFPNNLKNKIIEKLKVLNTVLEYNRGFQSGK